MAVADRKVERASSEELRDFMKTWGGDDAVWRLQDDFAQSAEYLDANHDQLTRDYPDEWIAIHIDQVIGHAFDPRDLSRQLDSAGVDRRTVVVHQMTTKTHTLLL